jgi:hypothetical protein
LCALGFHWTHVSWIMYKQGYVDHSGDKVAFYAGI